MAAEGGLSAKERERLQRQQRQQERERERQRAGQQLANQAAQRAMSEGEFAAPGYWDVIGDPDVGREETSDGLEELLATELSDKFALANVTHSDWERWRWRIETEMDMVLNEFHDPDGMSEGDLAEMYGEQRPELSDERARRIRATSQAKQAMSSLSINAQGLRSGTEIHAVARNESPIEDNEEAGYLDKAKRYLSR